MYNNLLNNVTNVIKRSTTPSASEKMDVMYYQMFNPKVAQERVEGMRKREELGGKLVLAATGLAVAGEVIHLAKRSGIIDKITKR